jgi:hypothetical protein
MCPFAGPGEGFAMSATLIATIPLALLGIVALLGFVGCWLHTQGIDLDPYDNLITGSESATTKLFAFWPLTETTGPTAFDMSSNKFNGTYMSNLGMTSYDKMNQSAGGSGNVNFGQPGLLPGDALLNKEDSSVFFDGGVVSVAFQQSVSLSPPFTVEAWVKPDPNTWGDATQPALRGVVVWNSTTSPAGFGLFAAPGNFWIFSLGVTTPTGSTTIQVPEQLSGTPTVDLNNTVYLAVTFDGQLCTIFASGVDAGPTQIAQRNLAGPKYVTLQDPNTPLFIGAGLPENGTSPPPKFPVVGTVQCVAIYNSILSVGTMQEHFTAGTTTPPPSN